MTPPPEDPPRPVDRVHNYRCTECGAKGHNARTCGKTPDERKAARRGRR